MTAAPLVLCGSGYGRHYVEALRGNRMACIVALLARGSARSRRLAEDAGVPLFTSVAALPEGVTAACVAVGGEDGARVTGELLDRGCDVLLEHPVTLATVRSSLARASGRRLHVNAHVAYLPAPARFAALAEAAAGREAPLHITIITGVRSLYSALDLVTRGLGAADLDVRGTTRHDPGAGPRPDGVGAIAVVGTYGNVPFTALVSSVASAVDDGSDAVFGQRILLTFSRGTLMLLDPWGPVAWSGVPVAAGMNPLSTTPLEAAGATVASFAKERLQAVASAVEELVGRGSSGEPAAQRPEHLETVARNWERLRAAVRSG